MPGGEIRYEDTGEGYPVLLFAPGFLSSRMERWRSNPARSGIAQDWVDPAPVLSPHFRVVSLDVRNAGDSHVAVTAQDDWSLYTGVSLALSVAQARPGMVTAMVLQNPIGLAGNRDTVQGEYDSWATQMRARPDSQAGGTIASASTCAGPTTGATVMVFLVLTIRKLGPAASSDIRT